MFKKEGAKLAAVGIFSIAMGYLEAAVVTYLRMLYCPHGFGFPLEKFMTPQVLQVEIARELSTLVMLLTLGYLAAARFKDRFAYFLFAFAVWDLFYYVGLKVLLDWPASFMTFDLLFLIPWAWVGPVLAPVILSVTMALLALGLLRSEEDPHLSDWVLLGVGSALVLTTFLSDYGRLLAHVDLSNGSFLLSGKGTIPEAMTQHVPGDYNWVLFGVGEAILLLGTYRTSRKGTKGFR